MNRIRPYLQLVRLPAVFTALADILLAALAVGVRGASWLTVAFLAAASASLYLSGMALNDFFDVAQDLRERPTRPIPSGRISRFQAGRLATILMAAALALASLAGVSIGLLSGMEADGWNSGPLSYAGLLIAAILAYDGVLKKTWAGPVGMGACRFLNVLLGLTALGSPLPEWSYHLAGVVGLYIVGVTWLARHEGIQSRAPELVGAAVLIAGSVILALALPTYPHAQPAFVLYPYLLVIFIFLVGLPVWRAIQSPKPAFVQNAVRRCLQGLVVFDAILATAWVGWLGLLILLLLVPIFVLGRWRWLYMT